MAQAAAPLAFGLLIDSMGSRVLIVSSALSLSALVALFLLRPEPAASHNCPFQSRAVSSKTPAWKNNPIRKPRPKAWVQWAMTPPQSYAVYLVCLFLVAGMSFYVGSLRPKKPSVSGRRRFRRRPSAQLISVRPTAASAACRSTPRWHRPRRPAAPGSARGWHSGSRRPWPARRTHPGIRSSSSAA